MQLAIQLSSGWWRLHTAAMLLLLLEGRPRTVWIRLTLPSGRSRRFYLRDYTQARALREVLVDQIYDFKPGKPVRHIVDLGSNAGQAAVYLLDRFPEAELICVEADPNTAHLTARNLANDPRATVVSAAVTDQDGTASLTSIAAYGWSWGSNVLAAGTPADAPVFEVRSVTLDTLLSDHGLDTVDLMKIDVEGAEAMLAFSPALRNVGCIVGESHPHMNGVSTKEIVSRMSRQGGFDRCETFDGEIFVLSRT